MKKIQIKIVFKGRVQGVFFRQHVKKYAKELNVFGYVKNKKDGSVEVVAVAKENVLEQFLNKIKNKPGYGSVKSIDIQYLKDNQKFSTFEIQS